jgi:hypothetical protein
MKKMFSDMGKDILKEYGFRDLNDLLHHIFAFQNFFVAKIQLLVGLLTIVIVNVMGFIDSYIWSPAIGLITISIMVVLRAITGALVKTRIKKEKFNVNKSLKTVPILLAHVAMMSLSWHIGNADGVMIWLPSAVFGIFATFHFLLLGKDAVELGYLPEELFGKLSKKIADKEEIR